MIAATMFSGIGAPEQAMPEWQWKWCAEIEKFPCAVLAARHPNTINLGDVNAEDFVERAAAIARPDVIVFGSPCQSFSVAGRRLGLDDARGNLALVALGIINRLKPRWFVFENVPGLLSSAEGRDFGLFLRAVDELGYSGAWAMLDAQYFGLAQRRERLFFVGSSGDWRGPAAVLFEPESLCGYSPPRRAPGERAAPTIEARTEGGGAGWGTDFLAGGGLAVGIGGDAELGHSLTGKQQKRWEPSQETHVIETPDVAWALQERDHKGADSDTKDGHLIVASPIQANEARTYANGGGQIAVAVSPPLRAGGNQTGGDRPHGTDVDTSDSLVVCFKPSHYTRDKDGAPSEVVPPLTKETDKGDQDPLVLAAVQTDATPKAGEVGFTLKQPSAPGGGQPAAVMAESVVRRLTPVECERLQGYPDNFTQVVYRGKPAADGPRYKALGNSMAVPVMRWILSRIEAVDAILNAAK